MKDITYIETHIADHCNLNCASCTHFSPLVSKPILKDLDEFKTEVLQIAKLFPNLKDFRILGREPLLNPNFAEFCKFAANTLVNTKIHLVTNGILVNKYHDILEDLINNYKVKIDISDYHLGDKVFNSLQDYITAKTKDTVHVSSRAKMYNPCLDFKNKLNAKIMYDRCLSNVNCTFLKDGRLYVCPLLANINYYLDYFNIKTELDYNKYSINIFEHTASEIMQFLEHNYSGCSYCNTPWICSTTHDFKQSEHKRSEWELPSALDKEDK